MSVPATSKITDAVVAALGADGITVGDGEKPDSVGWTDGPGKGAFLAYAVVYAMLGGTTDGPIADPDADAEPLYQITSVGGTRKQTEWLADKVRAVMLGGALLQTIAGRKIILVQSDVLPGATREDDSQPSLWFAPERFRLSTTPA